MISNIPAAVAAHYCAAQRTLHAEHALRVSATVIRRQSRTCIYISFHSELSPTTYLVIVQFSARASSSSSESLLSSGFAASTLCTMASRRFTCSFTALFFALKLLKLTLMLGEHEGMSYGQPTYHFSGPLGLLVGTKVMSF